MKLTIGDTEIGYDRSGTGEPLILVMGLGTPRIGWLPQVAALSDRFDVVTFDNRGCGETVCGPGSRNGWTMSEMSGDVLAIADEFGFDTFHLAGISMGGMISQELVLTAPERVRSLTLLSTSPGGPDSVPMAPEFTAAMMDPDPTERMRSSIELTFGETYRRNNPEMMELIVAGAMSGIGGVTVIGAEAAAEDRSAKGETAPDPTAGYFGQILAIVNWMADGGSFERLKTVEVPTLVLHGGADLLLPVGNGKLIAGEIPGARLRIWEDAGHALNFEQADDVNAELSAHIESAQAAV